jgi:hypothetical protein
LDQLDPQGLEGLEQEKASEVSGVNGEGRSETKSSLVEHDASGVLVDETLDRSDVDLPVGLGQEVVVANLGADGRDHGLVGGEERLGEKNILSRLGENGEGLL